MQKYVRDALIFLHSEHANDVSRLKIAEHLAGFRRQQPERMGESPQRSARATGTAGRDAGLTS